MATAQAINPGVRPRKNLKRSEYLGWCLCVVFLCGFCVCAVLQKCGFQPSLFSWAWDQQSGLEESTLARLQSEGVNVMELITRIGSGVGAAPAGGAAAAPVAAEAAAAPAKEEKKKEEEPEESDDDMGLGLFD
nr:unnamed protein product [Callosobruchus chinensis]